MLHDLYTRLLDSILIELIRFYRHRLYKYTFKFDDTTALPQ